MIVGIVFVESGQRRIPVQFAKRVVGRRMYGGQSTYIPLKVNQSGVIPVIFASSILVVPRAHRVGARRQLHRRAGVDQRQPGEQPGLVVHRLLHAADHLLLVLLHGDRVQPAAAGRHHPQAGRVHPGHPARAADRALPGEGAQPHHAAGLVVPRRRSRSRRCWCSRSGTSASSRSAAPRCSSPWASRSRR